MSDIKQKEHEAWWRGFKVGTESSIEVLKRIMKYDPKLPYEDAILKIKVAALNTRGER